MNEEASNEENISNFKNLLEHKTEIFKQKIVKFNNFWSKIGLKKHFLGPFLSLIGARIFFGIIHGIYKAIDNKKRADHQKLLDKSWNYQLIFELNQNDYKEEDWFIYAFSPGLKNNVISTFKNQRNLKGEDKFKKENYKKFSIKLKNVDV
ncbi:hypothetical protein [Mycoplasma phocimorsus]|uniref:hypothetical protein n=1 Tax=Mycoplasma phocimorsus TaxID=3045839 RepID=UPI0024C0AB75|nr:hypothetical protein [Mycoplasma phocimorsus]MDJ1648577.1 hypothetical protein [Mycoplasma phocimorsus]